MGGEHDISIRAAALGDEQSIYRAHTSALLSAGDSLEAHSYLRPDYYTPMIESGRAAVALIEGVVVGFGELAGREIRSIYVLKEHQRMGVGVRLLAALERNAARQGLDWVNIRCRKSLADAYYSRHGYVPLDEDAYRAAPESTWLDIVKPIMRAADGNRD